MKKKPQIILGIDPGTRATGYGVIKNEGSKYSLLDYGVITPSQKLDIHHKYLFIFEEVDKLIDKAKPHALSIETQFVQKNIQSAMKLGMARGVVSLAATKRGIPIFEYAPRKAKQATTGNGNASKNQVQRMIKMVLGLNELPKPEDAADALSLAICHAHFAKGALCLTT